MRKGLSGFITVIVLLVLFFVFFSPIRIVDNRKVACYITFGQISKEESGPGIKLVIPFAQTIKAIPINTQVIHFKEIPVLSNDGLQLLVDISVGYKIKRDKACDAFIEYGDIFENLVKPTVRSAIRTLFARFKGTDYYERRQEVEQEIVRALEDLKNPYFEIVQVNIRNIKLPEEVLKAIERKITAKQEAERMQYVLEKERLEAERKIVEAKGLAESQRIINNSLSDKYLRWYYITTMKELADNENSKLIIMPYDQKMLPLMVK